MMAFIVYVHEDDFAAAAGERVAMLSLEACS